MDNIWMGVALGMGLTILLFTSLALSRAGSMSRAWWGLTVAGRANLDPNIQTRINTVLSGGTIPVEPSKTTTAPVTVSMPKGEALRLLALLQAESRLIDFLMEDLSAASDEQIGQGVRTVQQKAAETLKKHAILQTVLPGTEGEQVTVARGFDPSAIRVLGNVSGEPPFTGELLHAGWMVKELKLPNIADGQNPMVLQPAEVQIA